MPAGRRAPLSPSPHRRLGLAVAPYPILVTRKLAQAHGAAGVEFVGGNADLGPAAEFEIGIQLNQGEAALEFPGHSQRMVHFTGSG